MNKIKLFLGGHPFTEDDIIFLESAYTESAKAIAFTLANQYGGYMILGGCKPIINTAQSNATSDVYDVSEGYLLYDFEVLKCEPHQVSVTKNAPLEYIPKVDFLPSGTTVYFNAVPHETHERTTVIVQELTQIGYEVDNMKSYSDALVDIQKANTKFGIANIVFEPNWSMSTTDNVEFKDAGISKILSGTFVTSPSFRAALAPYQEVVGVLDVSLRPHKMIIVACQFFTPINAYGIGLLTIGSNGSISLHKLENTPYREATIHVAY